MNGSQYGLLASTSEPALLAVTTSDVLRQLRENSMFDLIIADGRLDCTSLGECPPQG